MELSKEWELRVYDENDEKRVGKYEGRVFCKDVSK